jgi:hypothetical protein
MPRAFGRVVAAVAIFCGVFVAAPQSSAGNAEHFHETVDAAAEIFGSTCPFGDWVPAEDTVCEDWIALLFRATNEPQQHNRMPLGLELTRALSLVHPDGSVDTIAEVTGTAEGVDATFDEKHLRSASVRTWVPMSDGSTRWVDVSWDGSDSQLRTDGNNGPFNQVRGISRHHVDRCLTVNIHSHQTYRANVQASGTVDGTAVEDMPYQAPFDPFLGRGHFTVVVASHGGCSGS